MLFPKLEQAYAEKIGRAMDAVKIPPVLLEGRSKNLIPPSKHNGGMKKDGLQGGYWTQAMDLEIYRSLKAGVRYNAARFYMSGSQVHWTNVLDTYGFLKILFPNVKNHFARALVCKNWNQKKNSTRRDDGAQGYLFLTERFLRVPRVAKAFARKDLELLDFRRSPTKGVMELSCLYLVIGAAALGFHIDFPSGPPKRNSKYKKQRGSLFVLGKINEPNLSSLHHQ